MNFMEVGDKLARQESQSVSSFIEGVRQGRIPLPLLVTRPELILESFTIFPQMTAGLVAPGADFQPCSPPRRCVGSGVLFIGG